MRMPDIHPAARSYSRRASGPRGSSSTNTNRICANVPEITGRFIKSLVTGTLAAGVHAVAWDRTDEAGRQVESGVYFCRLESGGNLAAAKLVLGR